MENNFVIFSRFESFANENHLQSSLLEKERVCFLRSKHFPFEKTTSRSKPIPFWEDYFSKQTLSFSRRLLQEANSFLFEKTTLRRKLFPFREDYFLRRKLFPFREDYFLRNKLFPFWDDYFLRSKLFPFQEDYFVFVELHWKGRRQWKQDLSAHRAACLTAPCLLFKTRIS